MPAVTNLTERQIARNRQTRDQPSFASHREHVMQLIAATANALRCGHSQHQSVKQLPTITVLGAGNCQDLDLPLLTSAFREVRLIDIDADAVQAAVSQLSPDVTSRIQILAPIDIATPLMSMVGREFGNRGPDSKFLEAIESVCFSEEIDVSDVVVSTCLVSQLIDSAAHIVPPELPDFLPLIQAIRRGHLARMLHLTNAAGRALLITDLVSSDTVPDLKTISLTDLPKLLFQCLQSGDFFSGLNPAVVEQDLQHTPALMELCSASRILPPWLWTLGPRCFAVYAVEMLRS